MSEVTDYSTYALEELISRLKTVSYQLGIIVGLREASEQLIVRSGDQFMAERDSVAIHTRDLAHALRVMADKKRLEYEADFRPRGDAIHKEIERREKLYEPKEDADE